MNQKEGYVLRKSGFYDANIFCDKISSCFDNLKRCGLVHPKYAIVQSSFVILFFADVSGLVLQNFFPSKLLPITEKHRFPVSEMCCRTLVDILKKNAALLNSPKS